MTPIKTNIIRAYAEALSRVVAESHLTYSALNQGPSLDIVASGIYSGSEPRKFTLEVTDFDKVLVIELQGPDLNVPPALAPYTQTVVSGTPWEIPGTGISVTASFFSEGVLFPGDKFLLRMGKASTTMREVVPWQKSHAAVAHPGTIIYVPNEDKVLARAQGYMCELALVLEFLTDQRADDSEGFDEDVGHIVNELNRDLTQGDLCWKSEVNKVQLFDTDGVNVLCAQIHCTAYYRHITSDVSVRF